MNAKIRVLFFYLLIFGTIIVSGCLSPKSVAKDMQKCTYDSDCVLAQTGCCPTAVNKNFQKEVEFEETENIKCDCVIGTGVKCVEGYCKKVVE